MDKLLNRYQKTSLETALRIFEEDLRQAESWLDGHQVDGMLYRRQLSLAPSQRVELQKRISAALSEIAILAEKINLEQKFEDPAGLMSGQMSIAWANLIDSQASKLKRFGKVHPELAPAIDPHIRYLAQAALELSAMFGNHSFTPPSPDDEILFDI